jgi:hypothetical protein
MMVWFGSGFGILVLVCANIANMEIIKIWRAASTYFYNFHIKFRAFSLKSRRGTGRWIRDFSGFRLVRRRFFLTLGGYGFLAVVEGIVFLPCLLGLPLMT